MAHDLELENPYSSPLVRESTFQRQISHLSLRLVLYTHIACVVVCTVVSLANSRLAMDFPDPLMWALSAVAFPAFLAFLVCPLCMLAVVMWVRPAWKIVVAAVLVEVCLSFVQLMAQYTTGHLA